ncbi:cytosolic protein [Oceanobacillus arenosus]|uniref:Cytosolic protein n=1 Tax=Oceanobacillus arenosus TaxID=1229153 RepID=A0A3D8Q1E7_9BACI|nr:HTH domain-containing protein [Oceanobacillus arenosus]RDW20835.1 cytosolic protein [Oceanobacillus arenosus]
MITAYNKDVQHYLIGNSLSSKRKATIIEHIENAVNALGESFERLFPSRSKRKDVMDHVIYLLSGNGICKISASTLAEKADCSVRTVNAAVKSLKQTNEILVAGLADGKNKYIFVLKSHGNFKEIMKDVFYINADQIADQNAELENSKPLDTEGIESGKTSSNNNNSIKFKQEKDNKENVQQSIEKEFIEAQNDTEKEFKRINEYYVNEHQEMMYYAIKSGYYHESIKLNASIIGLRVGSNCDKHMFHHAQKALMKLDKYLLNGGTVLESIPALFTKMYADNLNYNFTNKDKKEDRKSIKHLLYNWLEEDGSVIV